MNRVLHWTLVAVIVVPVILTLLLLVSLALPIDRPNAFACTNASLVTVDAEVAPDRDGRIVGRDFLGCTVWWYGI